MSSTSHEVQQEVKKTINPNVKPEWLDRFLGKKFFEKCVTHADQLKNDINRYCITCDASTCKLCVFEGNHEAHDLLTIYRHVYQDVVLLSEMESHIHCEKIQPYKCNKKWVVSLTPLPHNGSGSLIEGNGACVCCKRKLTDPERFRFCSVACKYAKNTGKIPSRPLMANASTSASHKKQERKQEKKPEVPVKKAKRPRKGIPHRAPCH